MRKMEGGEGERERERELRDVECRVLEMLLNSVAGLFQGCGGECDAISVFTDESWEMGGDTLSRPAIVAGTRLGHIRTW